MTLQNNDDFLTFNSWGTHLLSFYTFPICFKCQMTVEWLTLCSSATSHTVVRGSASMILSVGHCQLLMAGHYANHSSSPRLLSPLQNFLNHHCTTVCSLAIPETNASLMFCVVAAILWPTLSLKKKIAQICSMSNIISIV